MKTIHKVLLAAGIVTVALLAGVGGYLGYEYHQYAQKLFLNNSTLNGVDVSCMSVDSAYNTIYEESQKKKLVLTAGTKELTQLDVTDFCEITVDRDAIQEGMDEITFSDFLQGKSRSYEADYSAVIDSEKAADCLKQKLSEVEQEKSKNAKITKDETGFELIEETYGTQINKKKLLKKIENSMEEIAKNQTTSIDVTEFYKTPSVKAEDLKADYEKLQDYLDWSITYKNSDVSITREDLLEHITYKNKKQKIVIDDSFLKTKVSELAQSLNTVGKTRKFKVTSYQNTTGKAHSGKEINVSGGTYGQIVNQDAEYASLSEFLKKCKSKQDREPEWSLNVQKSGSDDIGNTYIEISIDRQHLWYYVNGKLKMQTDIVTGMKGVHDTPTGVYYITERINGKYLTGDTYRTWVNKWMRLTNMGIGLHDATWKSSFGGSIYTYNGSHGCINLPYSFACDLFDAVYVGLPVIIYDEG
jgi:hypothetical protein